MMLEADGTEFSKMQRSPNRFFTKAGSFLVAGMSYSVSPVSTQMPCIE